MLTKKAQEMLPALRQCLQNQPIEKAWLFGSYSRGEEQQGSDVDILVRYSEEVSLFTISRIMLQIEKAIGHKVDLVEEGCLLPYAAPSANRDKLLIYERANLEIKSDLSTFWLPLTYLLLSPANVEGVAAKQTGEY